MTYTRDSIARLVTTAHTDLATWPQLPSFRQPMPSGRLPRYFVTAVFVSVAIHALLLWVVAANHTVEGPAAPSIGKPLNVSFVSSSSLDTASRDELDHEASTPVPKTEPAAQYAESPPEHSDSAAPKAESEPVEIPKEQEVQNSETPEDRSSATDAIPQVDPEDTNHIAQEVGRVYIPGLEAEPVMTSKDQGVPGSGVSGGSAGPSIDLEDAYRIAREIGRTSIPEYELQELRFASRRRYLKNRLGIVIREPKPLPDCRTAYSGMGFLGLPFLLKSTITDTGCTWEKKADRERPEDQKRQKDQERLGDFSSTINDLIFGY